MAVAEQAFKVSPTSRLHESLPGPLAAVADFRPIVRLTDAQKVAFRRDGFLVVENLTTPAEIAALTVAYDRLFTERRGWDTGDLFDMVGRDNVDKALSLPQLLWPSRYEPYLLETHLHASARSIAEQLLGPNPTNILEHAIMKPAGNGAATPWHQDDAFSRRGSGFLEALSIWMPLQDVTVGSGCMRYIRASNLGPLYPHRSPGNDPRIHGLEVTAPPNMKDCVDVPLPAGAGVVHHSRTIHSAGVNTSNHPRRAYILGFAVQTRRHSIFSRDYPWNLEKRTAREQRAMQNLPVWKRTFRKVRRLLRGG